MKIKFNQMEALAARIVCDLVRENRLSKGHELIGHLSFMIQRELERYCDHYWQAIPRYIPISPPELSPMNLDEPKKICKKCGVMWDDN